MTTFEEILSTDGILTYTNTGVSMMPLLRQGRDIMIIENVQDGRPLAKLDSVLFRRTNGQYVLHRIMCLPKDPTAKDPVYIICGDNTIQMEPVRRSMIIGRLIEVERNAGTKQAWTIHVGSMGERIYSRIAYAMWPIRRILWPIRWKIGGILHFLAKKFGYLKKKS